MTQFRASQGISKYTAYILTETDGLWEIGKFESLVNHSYCSARPNTQPIFRVHISLGELLRETIHDLLSIFHNKT